jgi:hypothetical protein
MSEGKSISDAVTNHAMAYRLKQLLGIAQAESIVAGIKLQAAQQVGHPALAALHADERMWDAVVKALTPQSQQAPAQPTTATPSAPQKDTTKPVATLEDIRATLVLHGQHNIAQMLEGGIVGSDRLLDAVQVIETTPWEGGKQAADMAYLATLLREMTKGKTLSKPPATPVPKV